jgi:hypothetical protein
MRSTIYPQLVLTNAQFDAALETNLLIVKYPSKRVQYYVCKNNEGKLVRVYIVK